MHVLRDWPSKIMWIYVNVLVEYLHLLKLCSMMFAHLVNAEYRAFLRKPSRSCGRRRARLLGFVIDEIHGVCIECMMVMDV